MGGSRNNEPGGGTGLLDHTEELPASAPDTGQCLQVSIYPGQAKEAEIQRALDALSELHDNAGGSGLDWCDVRSGESGCAATPPKGLPHFRLYEGLPRNRSVFEKGGVWPRFLDLMNRFFSDFLPRVYRQGAEATFQEIRDLIADFDLRYGTDKPGTEESIPAALFELLESIETIRRHGGNLRLDAAPSKSCKASLALEPPRPAAPVPLLTTDDAWKVIRDLDRLPAAPDNVLAIQRQIDDVDVNVADVLKYIEVDAGLTAAILRYTNSAFVGLRNKATHLQQAVALIGPKPVTTLALGLALRSLEAPRCNGFDYERFWSRSAACAVNARRLARVLKVGNPEEAFTAGLLCEIGSLALATSYPALYAEILEKTRGHESDWLLDEEKRRFGINHHEAGGRLMREWSLPETMCEAVTGAVHPAPAPDAAGFTLTDVLHWAANTSIVFTTDAISARPDAAIKARYLADEIGLTEDDFVATFNDSIDDWKETGEILQVATRELPAWPDILECVQPA